MQLPVVEGLLEETQEGLGFFETVTVTDPAAGSSVLLPDDFRYITIPLYVICRLVTDATAGNRAVTVDYLNGNGQVYARNGGGFVQAASLTGDYSFNHSRTGGEHVLGTGYLLPLAHDYIRPGYRIRLTVNGIQATDQLSGIVFGVDRLPTGPDGYLLGATRIGPHRAAGGFRDRRRTLTGQ